MKPNNLLHHLGPLDRDERPTFERVFTQCALVAYRAKTHDAEATASYVQAADDIATAIVELASRWGVAI
jgi:hypothetical protein